MEKVYFPSFVGKELLKAMQGKIPEEFLNGLLVKPYRFIIKKLSKEDIKNLDLYKVAELLLLYSRGESLKRIAKEFLAKACCFSFKGEKEYNLLYTPSQMILDKIIQKLKIKLQYVSLFQFGISDEDLDKIEEFLFEKGFPVVNREKLRAKIEKSFSMLNVA